MKDFAEFERLLDSDECKSEKLAIINRATEECKRDESYAAFPVMLANAITRYELRKYHEWINS